MGEYLTRALYCVLSDRCAPNLHPDNPERTKEDYVDQQSSSKVRQENVAFRLEAGTTNTLLSGC